MACSNLETFAAGSNRQPARQMPAGSARADNGAAIRNISMRIDVTLRAETVLEDRPGTAGPRGSWRRVRIERLPLSGQAAAAVDARNGSYAISQ